MRMDTLQGVHILFSSVIPLDTKPESTEIWKVAHMFGAQCYTELSSRITHVVAAKVARCLSFIQSLAHPSLII
jgi:RNA polymerase II subunit A-like phosphatase